MKMLPRAATAAVASLALVSPTLLFLNSASAAETVTRAVSQAAPTAADVVAKKKKGKIKLTVTKNGAATDGYHAGGTVPLVVTAKVKGQKGKVKFSVAGQTSKVKIKKGKAAFSVPLNLAPGVYPVTAKLGKKKGSVTINVWSSKLTLNQTTITVVKDAYPQPAFTGSVEWKGAAAQPGSYVDFYQDGNPAGGSSSPLLAGFGSIVAGGTFEMRGDRFESYFEKKALPYGTYSFSAFYTADSGFDDYIYSTPVTVVWAPPAA